MALTYFINSSPLFTVIISSLYFSSTKNFHFNEKQWRNQKLKEMKTFGLFMRLSGNERDCGLWAHSAHLPRSDSIPLINKLINSISLSLLSAPFNQQLAEEEDKLSQKQIEFKRKELINWLEWKKNGCKPITQPKRYWDEFHSSQS